MAVEGQSSGKGSNDNLSPSSRLFVAAIVAAGVILPQLLIEDWRIRPSWGFAAFLALSLMAAGWKVRIPGMNGSVTALLFFLIFGVAEMRGVEALAAALVATGFQCFWKARTRPKPIQVAFNVSVASFSVALASPLCHHPALTRAGLDPLVVLMLTAALLFVLNTAPTAAIISLSEGGQFLDIWRRSYFWTFPFYLIGAAATKLAEYSGKLFGWHIAMLISPVVYIAFRGYRVFVGRLEDEKRHSEEISGLHLRTIEALALAIEAKDQTTASHLARVQVYSVALGKEMGMSGEELNALRAASLLHDIGKLAVPEYIISKPGKLTPDEFEKMKIHPVVGAEILERVKFPYPVTPIVRSHHEKWNGKGYPDGLVGESIPMGSRILAVVDCLDALASDRQYRKALPLDEAMARVEAESGTSFDPRVVDVLKSKYQELEQAARQECTEHPTLSVDIAVTAGGGPAAGFEVSAEKPESAAQARSIDFIAAIAAARQEMQDLFEICQDLGDSFSLQETLSVFDVRLKRLVPFDCLAVYLTSSATLTPEYVCGENPLGSGLSGWVAETGKSIVNGNPAVESGYLKDPTKFTTMRSALSLPLREDDHVIAVLTLYSAEREAFSQDNLRVLRSIEEKLSRTVAASLRQRRAEKTALVDPLTGIANARALFLHLDAEVARCARGGLDLALVAANLDGFSQINLKLGHATGNDLLREVALTLRDTCRPYDFIARTGGDQFAIVIPELTAADVERRVFEFQSAIESMHPGSGIGLSITTGVSTCGVDGLDVDQLLSVADQRLHQARNRSLQPSLVA
jgi:diguanylate cyclase (GGDEF)-like protein/putative nucleotidyltransferase with HDIG domain